MGQEVSTACIAGGMIQKNGLLPLVQPPSGGSHLEVKSAKAVSPSDQGLAASAAMSEINDKPSGLSFNLSFPDLCRGAYLTVFLSLCLPIILSLFLTLIEGARINAARMQAEIVTDIAVDSSLAEFHRELLLQYDLLMVDVSYGTDTPTISNTEEHILDYMKNNFSTAGTLSFGGRDFTGLSVTEVSISNTRFAADNECAALKEQITAYYSAEPLGETVTEILAMVDTFNGLGLDTTEWSRLKNESESSIQKALEEAASEETGSSDENGDSESEELLSAAAYVESNGVSTSTASDLFSTLNTLLSQPVLTQALGGTSSLSQASVEGDELLSHRTLHTGDGADAEDSHDYEEAGTIMIDMYAFEKCGYFQNQSDKSVLQYQLEYLLNGKESDIENLEAAAQSLLLIRLAANLVTIMQDSGKQSTAQAWGTAISTLCLIPEAAGIFSTAILLIWTYMESILDVKLLLNGQQVPLIKSSSEWRTDLTSIFSGSAASASGYTSGLKYEDYLHILLFLENSNTKSYRLMDVMEMDIRATEGNENFQMDWCMDTFTVSTAVSSSFGYSFCVEREASYN